MVVLKRLIFRNWLKKDQLLFKVLTITPELENIFFWLKVLKIKVFLVFTVLN